MATHKRTALERRNKLIVGLLEKLSRHRALDAAECALLDEMLYRSARKNERWWWTKEEDAALARVNSNWARFGRPQPYVADDTIRELALRFGRSYFAVHRRLERLRKSRGWKRPQMFKRANGKAVLESANGQPRQAEADIGFADPAQEAQENGRPPTRPQQRARPTAGAGGESGGTRPHRHIAQVDSDNR
jgi:hypothetical protein